ncbi:hypothetical protein BH11ACT8_BH11ACT8_32050 [soil metagenome]
MSARRVGRAIGRVAPLVVACALLAGCGDSTGTDSTGTDDPTSGAPSVAGLTPPGTSLTLGDTATVSVVRGQEGDPDLGADGGKGVIDLTVTDIEEGDPADLGGLDGTPYYVRMKATAVSGDVYGFFVEALVGAWAGEEQVAPIATPLTVGTCTRAYFDLNAAPGTAIDTCATFVVDPGAAPIDRVGFEDDVDYRFEDGTDVEWQ